MFALAGLISVLYFVAIGFWLHERPAQAPGSDAAGPDDDEASELDLTRGRRRDRAGVREQGAARAGERRRREPGQGPG